MKHQQQKKYRNNALTYYALMLPLLTALLVGCSDSPKARPAAATSPAVGKKQNIVSSPVGTALPKIEELPAEIYSYRPAGRRDPFAPIISKQDKKAKTSDRPPLERYNISEFKLTAIIWGGFGYNAMIEGPDGKGYFIRVGTIVGTNRGKVKKITQNAMIIEEQFKNLMGETERKEITVELRKKQEERP
jgi:Tfp pilus assembly protein PilP